MAPELLWLASTLLCLLGTLHGDGDRWREHTLPPWQQWEGQATSLSYRLSMKTVADPALLGGWVECA